MNRPELYHETIDVLLDAYNEEKLHFGDSEFCAVGNILFHTIKKHNFKTSSPKSYITWYKLWYDKKRCNIYISKNYIEKLELELEQIVKCSGYTKEELIKISNAFEKSILNFKYLKKYSSAKAETKKRYQYKGLCAVLNVLKEIHSSSKQENNDSLLKIQETTKHRAKTPVLKSLFGILSGIILTILK